ncbi:MAG: 2-C-methyl-D-erythritol 2,4-cyclodiphosphate synthase [Dehalococcoidia bacterium]|nr:2-C-methyl-D-erythritol 2,4-cyclodiphosphate synthase [Dehalococcoidia bacterium]
MRIGIGYDIHRLSEGRDLTLGGVRIPHYKGLVGHSDGDVLLHAIADSMLGAAGLGDIGSHFSPSDPQLEGISSLLILEQINTLITGLGWRVSNLDATIVAEKPKLAEYIPLMKEEIAGTLKIAIDSIGIKAKTNEGLGAEGSEEAITAYVVALIVLSTSSS